MAAIHHWHPVLEAGACARGPRAVTLCGREVVVFRTEGGALGAMPDRCPHRGMRLSRGWVERERLVCPYHGWSFDCRGEGESPGTPKLRVACEHFDVTERYGHIWLRAQGGEEPTEIPALDPPGYHPVCQLHHVIEAPLEVVLDNFCEVEHTPTTHALLGYAREALASVETRVEVGEDRVRVINRGPQKRIPFALERLVGVYTGDLFTDDWTTHFSPVHVIYDQYWQDPRTGLERANRLKVAVFFSPEREGATALTTFAWSTLPPHGRLGLNALLRPLMARLIGHEIELDKRMVEALADKRPGLEGLRLGRFDKALGENRRLLERIYRGRASSPPAAG